MSIQSKKIDNNIIILILYFRREGTKYILSIVKRKKIGIKIGNWQSRNENGDTDNINIPIEQRRNEQITEMDAVSYAEARPLVIWTGKTKCGRVSICLDGWRTGKKKNYNSYLSRSPVRRTARSALHVMLLSYYIGKCVFHEHQRDICRCCAYSQGFAMAVHMSNDRQTNHMCV